MSLGEELAKKILRADRLALAKGMTLVCSHLEDDRKESELLIKKILENSKPAFKIGVTGIGGVGKSSFIEILGKKILDENPKSKLGILTIDPSSPEHGGSILGDTVRMPSLVQDERVFLRSTSNKNFAGGINQEAWEMSLLFEGASCDFILIESVGTGQSDDLISLIVDVTLLLQMPASGDNMQAIKKGSIEKADMIIIHKHDGILEKEAQKASLLYKQTQNLLDASKKRKHPPVELVSSKEETGFEKILTFLTQEKSNTQKKSKTKQLALAFDIALVSSFKEFIASNLDFLEKKSSALKKLEARKVSPLIEARKFIKMCFNLEKIKKID